MKNLANISPTNKIPCGGITFNSENLIDQESVSSIDTLSVSLWLNWENDNFFSEMQSGQDKAKAYDIPTMSILFGDAWSCHRFAPSYYKFHLSSGDVNIYFSSHASDGRIANCKIDIGSLSCWSGVEEIFNKIVGILASVGAKITKEIVSRVDLCVDTVDVMRDIHVNNEDNWICKASTFGVININRSVSYVTYGKGSIKLRIYDKTLELKQKQATNKQEKFAKIWGFKSYDDKPVVRTEFQFRRKSLKQFVSSKGDDILATVHGLVGELGGLWQYAVVDWARHTRGVDRNNHVRAKLSEFWKKITSVSWCHSDNIRRVGRCRKNITGLTSQMRGIATTIVSSLEICVDDTALIVKTAAEILTTTLERYIHEHSDDFKNKYNQRQSECRMGI
jgi:hypothetical protein